MSVPTQNELKDSEEVVVDKGGDEEATTSKPNQDIFVEIDKRLGLLLARANKLETTLNQLNGKRVNDDDELDMDLLKDTKDEESFEDEDLDIDITESDDFDLDTEDNAPLIDDVSENLEKIYLDIQDD